MSVLTDPATYGIFNSELTKCPHTAAVLEGELAAQWQQMMWTIQRVKQETASSQNLANAIDNMSKTRIDARATIEGRRATQPEELVGQHATRRVCT